MNDKNKFSYMVGQTIGAILITCAAICIACIAVALTVKFVTWIF